jgi:hypothetical protein
MVFNEISEESLALYSLSFQVHQGLKQIYNDYLFLKEGCFEVRNNMVDYRG